MQCTLCLKNMHHPIVTIILSSVDRFTKFFRCWKAVKFATAQYITLPTTPKLCWHTTSRNYGIRITSLQTSPQCYQHGFQWQRL